MTLSADISMISLVFIHYLLADKSVLMKGRSVTCWGCYRQDHIRRISSFVQCYDVFTSIRQSVMRWRSISELLQNCRVSRWSLGLRNCCWAFLQHSILMRRSPVLGRLGVRKLFTCRNLYSTSKHYSASVSPLLTLKQWAILHRTDLDTLELRHSFCRTAKTSNILC